jgi:hypothetical protein
MMASLPRHSRESGNPAAFSEQELGRLVSSKKKLDSRFRGNDGVVVL